jgi:2-polyprenyl-6-methoxyphenol hydroxylase-like FAD-dependent oxidoreductase
VTQQKIGEHAVVIGASVAGLLAARALADAYERVTIVERDELPTVGEGRKAVPQGRHAHVMLASGLDAIEELLPGIADELLEGGARPCRSLREIRLVISGHLLSREAAGADVLLASRPLIEGHIRRRVVALENVTVRDRRDAAELLTSSDGRRVSGVLIRPRVAGGPDEACDADLTVAASGRSARVPALLEALGYRRPEEERLPIDLLYVSRRLRLPAGALPGDRLIGIGACPGLPRGLMLIEQEDHWILTASGYGAEHHPPTDERGYLHFIASVAPPDVMAALRDAEPLSEIVTHGFPANQRRRYERLKRFPAGLLAVGDAISSFNPLYGQGMSVAALEAVALRRCLERGDGQLGRRFFRAAGQIVGPAWEMAVGGDLALPEVDGDRPPMLRLTNSYVERLLHVAEQDPVVAAAFNDVADLLAPPQSIMRPRVLWRVLRGPRRLPQARAVEGAGAPGVRELVLLGCEVGREDRSRVDVAPELLQASPVGLGEGALGPGVGRGQVGLGQIVADRGMARDRPWRTGASAGSPRRRPRPPTWRSTTRRRVRPWRTPCPGAAARARPRPARAPPPRTRTTRGSAPRANGRGGAAGSR